MAAAAIAIGGKGLEDGKFKDLPKDDPELDKFKKMLKMGLQQGAIENAMMRDGILPSCLFDNPLNKPTPPKPLVINRGPAKQFGKDDDLILDSMIPPPPPPPASDIRPPPAPPGMSLIEEMKWRQANNNKKKDSSSAAAANDEVSDIKIPERKKSMAQPQRMVALKPASTLTKLPENPAEAPKKDMGFAAPALKPAPKPANTSAAPVAKYTGNVYTAALKPVARNFDKKPEPAKAAAPKLKSNEPASEKPKPEIEFMTPTTDMLFPQQKPLESTILTDGTKISRDKDGGFTQVNPNGMIIRQFADGATKQTNPDGTIIEVTADGSKTTQVNPDGTRFEHYKDGDTVICFPDGAIVREQQNGEKIQTNPDGAMIHTYPDGKKVQTSLHDQIEITSYPDGRLEQVDKATGKKIVRNADGTMQQM